MVVISKGYTIHACINMQMTPMGYGMGSGFLVQAISPHLYLLVTYFRSHKKALVKSSLVVCFAYLFEEDLTSLPTPNPQSGLKGHNSQ
jgi:hypothetical protein